tara:strand:+ start:245 stop:772 length:528 start_codon:yes stop_codon:yes gene_type:complete
MQYFWEQIYTPKEIGVINKKLLKCSKTQVFDGAQGVVKTSQVFTIEWDDAKKHIEKFYKKGLHMNAVGFGYHLYPHQWHIKYNIYKPKKEYGWHTDGDNSVSCSDCKLTCLLNMSESSYEGGTLEISNGMIQRVVEFDTPGSMICFPSFLMHRVRPVLKGIRKSISLLINGPKWV